MTISEVQDLGCRACASPGGGCQFLGTAATSQVVAEALGLALTHSALAPSGEAVWLDMALRSARAVFAMQAAGLTTADVVTDAAVHNAMVTHAAFGGSTNLLLHIPAVAYAAGLSRPTVADWSHVNRQVPRLVDVLPNGPEFHPTVRAFLAGGVPEVMLHLRSLGLLETGALTISGRTLGENLDWWEGSERRSRLRAALRDQDGVDPDNVIMDAGRARDRGLTSTVCFPTGNIAPEGSVVKSTAIDPSVVDGDGVYRMTGPVKVFTTERAAAAALKDSGPKGVKPGDVMVLIGRGPMGAGMEEIAQITTALKYLDFGKHVAVLTDARFSGLFDGGLYRACRPGSAGRRPHRQVGGWGTWWRSSSTGRTSRAALTSSARARPVSDPTRGVASWPTAPRAPTCRPTRTCRKKPGCGRPCRTWGAAPGAGACTTSKRS